VALLVRNVHQKDLVSMNFADLRLAEPLLRAVTAEGYSTATPIQAQAIPHVLRGRDVLGCAQTGTGKTAAFALPILQRLSVSPRPAGAPIRVRCLVLSPTRELATQIDDSFRAYGKFLRLRSAVVFGGVGQGAQVQAIRSGLDVLVATPGRLLDLMNQGYVDLRGVEVLVLDESDRMLDMGFIHDVRRIVAQVPAKRQTLLFSATMPTEIRRLADTILNQPVSVQVTPPATTVERIEQSVYFVRQRNKPVLLAHLVNELPMARALVFSRTKHGADRVVRQLHSRGIRSEAIHGNKSQNARERALANFKSGRIPVLVATDIAARGIDIDDITHVVNYDLTHEPETYVHRIGRTGRAGASGTAVSFCDNDERESLSAIQKLIRRTIPVKNDHPPYPATEENRDHAPAAPRHAPRQHHHRETQRASRSHAAHAAHAAPATGASQPARVSHPLHRQPRATPGQALRRPGSRHHRTRSHPGRR
jgi:ATP-dependent RNA helicase RhlE